ncbi:MAG: hypothetical protein GC131_07625 [Alphaproteobacteria bacterium]|nr:hypothetical protein [Alphaproteobacteria bacterium]
MLKQANNLQGIIAIRVHRANPAHCGARPARKLNEVELKSIHALLNYAAANTNMLEGAVVDRLCALCDAMQLEDIEAAQYEAAVRFLVDFNSRVN